MRNYVAASVTNVDEQIKTCKVGVCGGGNNRTTTKWWNDHRCGWAVVTLVTSVGRRGGNGQAVRLNKYKGKTPVVGAEPA